VLVVRRVVLLAGLAGLAATAPAAAHGPDGFAVPDGLWRAWTWDPWVLGGVLLSSWLYSRGVERLWRRAGTGRGVRVWQAASFAAGTLLLLAALVSPLHALGEALFSAHMMQHVLLMVVAAPLLVLGSPLVAFVWALPPRWRVGVGAWARRPAVRRPWRAATHPVGAWSIHAAALWAWHVPVLYQSTLASDGMHFLQHASFVGTALLFWEGARRLGTRHRGAFGGGVLYVFTTAVHSSLLGALLTFSLVLWYPAYAVRAPAWGVEPLADQQLGGLVMWIPAGVVYLLAVLALLWVGLAGSAQRPVVGAARTARPVGLATERGS
jgi:putative membrane protein